MERAADTGSGGDELTRPSPHPASGVCSCAAAGSELTMRTGLPGQSRLVPGH
jgi:hypothetical protein